jgi:hypothetical protein
LALCGAHSRAGSGAQAFWFVGSPSGGARISCRRQALDPRCLCLSHGAPGRGDARRRFLGLSEHPPITSEPLRTVRRSACWQLKQEVRISSFSANWFACDFRRRRQSQQIRHPGEVGGIARPTCCILSALDLEISRSSHPDSVRTLVQAGRVQTIRRLAMLRIHADTRIESEVKAALNALNRMLELRCPISFAPHKIALEMMPFRQIISVQ